MPPVARTLRTVQDREWQARRLSFGPAAAVYDRTRPEYPAAAIRWLVGDRPCRVLDLGAGTGKLTRGLRALGHDVVAVDPDDGMLAALSLIGPEVPALLGTAEQIPLPAASVDAVVAGQAYHWFGGDAAHAEIARVLRPGGPFGPLWNVRDDRVAWVAELSRLIGSSEDTWTAWRGEPPELGPLFGPVEEHTSGLTQTLDLAGLQGLVASRSYVLTLPKDERQAVLDRVAELTRTHPDLRGRDTVELAYVTHAFRAAKR